MKGASGAGRELVVNVTPEESRVVLLEAGRPVEILVERGQAPAAAGSLHLGRVERVLPGMQSAFVDLGLERHAFLHVSDAEPESAATEVDTAEQQRSGDEGGGRRRRSQPDKRIEDLLQQGQTVLVQVSREPSGKKGPRVTRHVSLPGAYLVYLPHARQAAVSRRIADEAQREALKATLERLRAGEGGLIARTAALGQSEEVLAADLAALRVEWREVEQRVRRSSAPALVRSGPPLALRVLRDLAAHELTRIVVDDPATHADVVAFLDRHEPGTSAVAELYQGQTPLFVEMGLEQEVEKALREKVWLKSGGTLVINQLEALVAVDVNTGKYTGSKGLDETVLQTNLEAAREVPRQLRLRDLGGIVVIDFIDMEPPAHRQQVLSELEQALARDRAKTTVLGMSEFGLVQVTRQRQRPSLQSVLTEACAHCAGTGRVASAATTASAALRRLRGLQHSGPVTVRAHPDVAAVLRGQAGDSPELHARLTIVEEPNRARETFDLQG